MVVKSTTNLQHDEALVSMISILKKHQLKLNLKKCSFGVQVGRFLGASIVWEVNKDQHLVYFISKILQGVETRCQKIEMAALALVTTATRLRLYFHSHQVIVTMGLPIKQVLRKPEMASRMVRWVVKLSEFDIIFERRGHIRV
ncbi:hypothetical protein CR513_20772, partial [Mucuna pruriens]